MSKDVKKYDICSSSGKVAIKGVCPTSKSEYFAKGTQPAKCTYHSAFSKKEFKLFKQFKFILEAIVRLEVQAAQAPAIQVRF